MNWFLKIPGLHLERWAAGRAWPELLERWREEGISAVICPFRTGEQEGVQQLEEFREQARQAGLQFWLTLSVFNHPAAYRERAVVRAVPRSEMDLPAWFGPICPGSEMFRLDFGREFLDLLERLQPDTVLLDHFRVPYAWEEWGVEIAAGEWPVFCYCARCRTRFEHETGTSLEEATPAQWLHWQQEVLAAFLKELFALAETIRPRPALGLQFPPFVSPTRWRLRHEWAGLNMALLQKYVDFFSPLLYSRLLGWNDDEMLAYLVSLRSETKLPLIPGLQVVPTR